MAVMNPNGKKNHLIKKNHEEFLNWQWSNYSMELTDTPTQIVSAESG